MHNKRVLALVVLCFFLAFINAKTFTLSAATQGTRFGIVGGPTNDVVSGVFLNGRCRYCQIDCGLDANLWNCQYRYFTFVCDAMSSCPSLQTASQPQIEIALMICITFNGCSANGWSSRSQVSSRAYQLMLQDHQTRTSTMYGPVMPYLQLLSNHLAIDFERFETMTVLFTMVDVRRSYPRATFAEFTNDFWYTRALANPSLDKNLVNQYRIPGTPYATFSLETLWSLSVDYNSYNQLQLDKYLKAGESWRSSVARNEQKAQSSETALANIAAGISFNDLSHLYHQDNTLIGELNRRGKLSGLRATSGSSPLSDDQIKSIISETASIRQRRRDLINALSKWQADHRAADWGSETNFNLYISALRSQNINSKTQSFIRIPSQQTVPLWETNISAVYQRIILPLDSYISRTSSYASSATGFMNTLDSTSRNLVYNAAPEVLRRLQSWGQYLRDHVGIEYVPYCTMNMGVFGA